MCKISAKNIKPCGSWSSSKLLIFRQIAWFLRNNRTLSKFRYWILYNVISITKLWKDHSIQTHFNLTTRTTLSAISELINIYYSWNHKKTIGFLMISGAIEANWFTWITLKQNIRSKIWRQYLRCPCFWWKSWQCWKCWKLC